MGLSFYAFIAIGVAEGGLGVLLPSILATYHLTPATVTVLFLSQITGYMTAAVTSSVLSSRFGLARMLLFAAIALTSALSLYALTTHWPVMVLTASLLGLGIGLIDAGINSYIASDQRNANAMGILHAFYGIGALLGPTIATVLLSLGVGWRQVYLVVAAITVGLIVGLVWAVRSNYQPMTKCISTSASHARANLSAALKSPIVRVTGVMLMIYVGTEVAIGNWAYMVQTVSRGVPTWIAGYSISGYWFGLTIGRVATGLTIKRLGAIRALDVSFSLLIVGIACWWLLPQQLWPLPLMGFALATVFPTTIWLMPQRVPPALVPAAIGFLASFGSLGAATIPMLLGWIADLAGVGVIPGLLLPLAVMMFGLHRWLASRPTSHPISE